MGDIAIILAFIVCIACFLWLVFIIFDLPGVIFFIVALVLFIASTSDDETDNEQNDKSLEVEVQIQQQNKNSELPTKVTSDDPVVLEFLNGFKDLGNPQCFPIDRYAPHFQHVCTDSDELTTRVSICKTNFVNKTRNINCEGVL